MDWWNIRAEHTPYEWELQYLMYQVCPFGERRADMRAAHIAANMLAAKMKEAPSDDEFRELVHSLSRYLKCEQAQTEDEEEQPDMRALDIMMQERARNGTA